MKSLIYIIIVFIIAINLINAQHTESKVIDVNSSAIIPMDFEIMAEIKVNTSELLISVVNRETQFEFINKQKTDFIPTMYIRDILKTQINLPANELNNIFVVFENSQGHSVVAAYSEFDPLLTAIPAVLTAKTESVSKKSKVTLQDNDGEMDMEELDALLAGGGPKLKIKMQIKNIPVTEKEKMMLDATVIFPKDLNTDRWINNIDKIKVYRYIPVQVPKSEDEPAAEENVKSKKPKKKK